MIELWGTSDLYKRYRVSTSGRVANIRSGKIKKNSLNRGGYEFVNLYDQDMAKPTPVLVHRLVALTFLPGPQKETVNHADGNKRNNCVSNLEWMTRAENASHAWATGLTPVLAGEYCGKSILNNATVLEIRRLFEDGMSQVGIAARFGVTQANISEIVRRRTWKHI